VCHNCVLFLQIKKPLIERRRRERINDSLNQLKNLVLQATNKDVSRNFFFLHKIRIYQARSRIYITVRGTTDFSHYLCKTRVFLFVFRSSKIPSSFPPVTISLKFTAKFYTHCLQRRMFTITFIRYSYATLTETEINNTQQVCVDSTVGSQSRYPHLLLSAGACSTAPAESQMSIDIFCP